MTSTFCEAFGMQPHSNTIAQKREKDESSGCTIAIEKGLRLEGEKPGKRLTMEQKGAFRCPSMYGGSLHVFPRCSSHPVRPWWSAGPIRTTARPKTAAFRVPGKGRVRKLPVAEDGAVQANGTEDPDGVQDRSRLEVAHRHQPPVRLRSLEDEDAILYNVWNPYK